jgi:tetratricopeptide (TPR) repeat protein
MTDALPDGGITAERTGAVNQFGVSGVAVAVTGFVVGDVHVHARQSAVRSGYLEQVRRMAPEVLRERESELAELTRFCMDEDPTPYRWLRAEAWAGKSALMSWFVLHPPVGVRVVSFFVTTRYAGQSDRIPYTVALLEQLAELLDKPPEYSPEATRDGHLLRMLTEAAELCQRRGERLVLVVDGLDEDTGVTVGPAAYSIAALLPARPPAGVRIIVTGRRNPPIPSDVPDNHPLRDKNVVRSLVKSRYAEVVRQDAERELKRLLCGTPIEQELLGLVTAAGGGLSVPDLAKLTDHPATKIEDHLNTVFGRTFTPHVGQWRTEPTVYVLSHVELQRKTVKFLGDTTLNGHRQRLHAWADRHREQGWPDDTPEYLLHWYFGMLRTTSNLDRMVAFATDHLRHNRMRHIARDDTLPSTEIGIAQDAILRQDEPNLMAMLRLAVHRDLRGAWVARPASLLAEFAEAANAAGDIGLVKDLVNRAEALTGSGTGEDMDPTLRALSRALSAIGEADSAEDLARSIAEPDERAQALARQAQAAAEEGDTDRVDALAAQVKALSHSICNPYLRARLLIDLAEAVAIAGDADKAESLAIWAEAVAGRICDPDQYGYTLMRLAEVAAAAGDFDRAEALTHRIPDPDLQAGTLNELEETVKSAGYPDRAKAIARPSGDRPAQLAAELLERALANLVEVVATASDTHEAGVIARQAAVVISLTTNQTRRREALIGLAQEVVAAAGTDRAGVLAKRAELLVGSITDRCLQADVLVNLARATAGEPKWADDLTRSIGEPDKWARALAGAAQDIEPVRARRYIALALRLGHWTTPLTALSLVQPEVLTAVAEELLPAADR